MRNILIWMVVVAVLATCSPKPADETPPPPEPVQLPVEFTYKGTPTMGDMNHAKTVLSFIKRLNDLNADVGEFFADSVTVHFADGNEFSMPKDSVVADITHWLGGLSSMNISYTAAMAIDNKSAGHEWVFTWTDETYNHKDGSEEHMFLHEDYRLENGKIREVFQYSRKPAKAEGDTD